MLSPYDIEVKKFDRGFRGYNKAEVDDFMQAILSDYEKLYKENGVLKSKMQVLVEKIEEYKRIEDSLRNAVVSAQKIGESMIKDATAKSELVIQETNIKAERMISNINMQIYKEKQALEDAKRENKLFSAKLLGMYQAQISLLKSGFEQELKPGSETISIENEVGRNQAPSAERPLIRQLEETQRSSYEEKLKEGDTAELPSSEIHKKQAELEMEKEEFTELLQF